MTSENNSWYVYIVECADGTYYTGITTDLTRRLLEHNSSTKGAKYTRTRRPVKMLAHISAESRSGALKIEAKIKKQKRNNKIAYLKSLIKESNSEDRKKD